MKNKTLKLIFILSVFIMSFLLMTTSKADVVWNSEDKIITISYGDNITPYLEIDDYIDTTGRAASSNNYYIVSTEGASIFTGWNQAQWQNSDNSYYGRMNVATDVIGEQTMTIRFTPAGNGTPVETTLTIRCVGSDNLKTVITALNGSMPNSYTLNTDNVYTSLSGLTAEKYETILDAADAYNGLGSSEKAYVDQILAQKLSMTEAQILDEANNGLEVIANDFVDSTHLKDSSITDINNLREVFVNVNTLSDEFENLSPRTKAKVLSKLSNNTNQFNSWDEVKEYCEEQVEMIDAAIFLHDYIDYTEDVLDEDKVLEGEESWNNSKDAVKTRINNALLNTSGIEKTYPELLSKVKANRFIKDNLTNNDKVIVEANNSNYKQIIAAKDAYNTLSDEAKEEVNKILTEEGNTTYPELLKDAQKLEPTPKTGDIVVVMAIALAVSTIGLAVTFIIKR